MFYSLIFVLFLLFFTRCTTGWLKFCSFCWKDAIYVLDWHKLWRGWIDRYIMRRYSPPYYSPPRRGYGGRVRSPPRRGYGGGGGYGRRKDQNSGSLLVRNIPLDCRYLKFHPLFVLLNWVWAFKRYPIEVFFFFFSQTRWTSRAIWEIRSSKRRLYS